MITLLNTESDIRVKVVNQLDVLLRGESTDETYPLAYNFDGVNGRIDHVWLYSKTRL